MASFNTSWARLHLNKALQLLGERVLYYDTDSIIYLEEPRQHKPLLVDYLGELISERDRRLHQRIRVGRSQELWVQNQEGQSRMQSPWFPAQQRGKTQLNYDVMRPKKTKNKTKSASERPRRNPTPTKGTAPNPSRQNVPDRA